MHVSPQWMLRTFDITRINLNHTTFDGCGGVVWSFSMVHASYNISHHFVLYWLRQSFLRARVFNFFALFGRIFLLHTDFLGLCTVSITYVYLFICSFIWRSCIRLPKCLCVCVFWLFYLNISRKSTLYHKLAHTSNLVVFFHLNEFTAFLDVLHKNWSNIRS